MACGASSLKKMLASRPNAEHERLVEAIVNGSPDVGIVDIRESVSDVVSRFLQKADYDGYALDNCQIFSASGEEIDRRWRAEFLPNKFFISLRVGTGA